jgi:hypothetical protein
VIVSLIIGWFLVLTPEFSSINTVDTQVHNIRVALSRREAKEFETACVSLKKELDKANLQQGTFFMVGPNSYRFEDYYEALQRVSSGEADTAETVLDATTLMNMPLLGRWSFLNHYYLLMFFVTGMWTCNLIMGIVGYLSNNAIRMEVERVPVSPPKRVHRDE